MKLSNSSLTILKFIAFRNLMGATFLKSDAIRVFGDEKVELFQKETGGYTQLQPEEKLLVEETLSSRVKSKFATDHAELFQIMGMVKYVAVTGSVAAGFAKESDDIDLFIIVKNHTSWIYRGLLMIKLFKRVLHVGEENKSNKFCVNFICEERGLSFEERDLFILHELLYMKPIYNPQFLDQIYLANQWMSADYGVLVRDKEANAKRNREMGERKKESRNLFFLFLGFLNLFFMLFQLVYMFLSRHSPNLKRILCGYRDGRIAFYPTHFKSERLEDLNAAVSNYQANNR